MQWCRQWGWKPWELDKWLTENPNEFGRWQVMLTEEAEYERMQQQALELQQRLRERLGRGV